jgi:hypothetical protein
MSKLALSRRRVSDGVARSAHAARPAMTPATPGMPRYLEAHPGAVAQATDASAVPSAAIADRVMSTASCPACATGVPCAVCGKGIERSAGKPAPPSGGRRPESALPRRAWGHARMPRLFRRQASRRRPTPEARRHTRQRSPCTAFGQSSPSVDRTIRTRRKPTAWRTRSCVCRQAGRPRRRQSCTRPARGRRRRRSATREALPYHESPQRRARRPLPPSPSRAGTAAGR